MKNKIELIYSILSGSAFEEDELHFQEFLRDEENNSLFRQLKKIWDESVDVKNYKKYEAKRAFYEITKKIEQHKKQKRRYLVYAVSGVAAGILLVLGIFNLIQTPEIKSQVASVVVETEIGNRSVVMLPDSTKVWLNSKTQLVYDSDFGKETRNVSLSGEGFFEVKPSNKPFVVDIKDFKVKVYGTAFNISSYPDDNSVYTSLESGKISILKEGRKEFFVKPGQLVIYEKEDESFNLEKADVNKYSAWRSNKMYLNNESFNSLAKKLERKYNVSISFLPPSLGDDIHYSGVFSDEDISDILDAVSIASGIKYVKKGNQFIIQYK